MPVKQQLTIFFIICKLMNEERMVEIAWKARIKSFLARILPWRCKPQCFINIKFSLGSWFKNITLKCGHSYEEVIFKFFKFRAYLLVVHRLLRKFYSLIIDSLTIFRVSFTKWYSTWIAKNRELTVYLTFQSCSSKLFSFCDEVVITCGEALAVFLVSFEIYATKRL